MINPIFRRQWDRVVLKTPEYWHIWRFLYVRHGLKSTVSLPEKGVGSRKLASKGLNF